VSEYGKLGIDYDVLDASKRDAIGFAQSTSHLLERHGARAVDASRGASAFVLELAGQHLAFVVEGLGTKSIIARQVQEQLGVNAFDSVAYDTVAAIVNDDVISTYDLAQRMRLLMLSRSATSSFEQPSTRSRNTSRSRADSTSSGARSPTGRSTAESSRRQ